MSKRRVIDRRQARKLARERMDILFGLAREVFASEPELARRYVGLARRIGSRCNVRLTPGDKLRVCRDCNAYLVPGVNCRVRAHSRRIVVSCLDCGGVRRVPVTRERRGKLNKAPLVNTG
jgi:ribonuclease P protein subunit RPR2